VECTNSSAAKEVRVKEWMLFVDEASNAKESGAAVVLISPKKEVLEYSLCFTFPNSNNAAEYEALLVGMRLAKKLKVKSLTTHNNS